MSDPMNEMVVGVHRNFTRMTIPAHIINGHGLVAGKNVLSSTQCKWNAFSAPRGILEYSNSYKHFATYTILREGEWYFSYRRKGTEGRLDGMRSLGVGGHIGGHVLHREDTEAACKDEAIRELYEEYRGCISFITGDVTLIGTLNDERDAVGRVHLGIAYLAEIDNDEYNFNSFRGPRCRLEDPRWISAKQIKETKDEYESWSSIIIDEFIK